MGKVSLLGCSRPKLVYPRPSTRAAVREGSKSASTLFTPAPFSKLPEGPQQKAGEERCHLPASTIPGGAQQTLGEQVTQRAAPHPTHSPEQRHHPPLTPSQLLSHLGPRRNPWHLCPTAKRLEEQQGSTWLYPRPGPGCSQIWGRSSRQAVY